MAGEGVTGSNADAATCMSFEGGERAEQDLVRRHQRWKLRRRAERRQPRSGKSLGKNQLWWTFTRSTAIGSQITSAVLRQRRLGAAGRQLRRRRQHDIGDPITNGSTNVRNKWLELDYAGLADAVNKGVALQPTLFSDLITDKAGSRQSCAISAAR